MRDPSHRVLFGCVYREETEAKLSLGTLRYINSKLASETAGVEDFLRLRDSLQLSRVGDGGSDLCRELTSCLDTVIGDLASHVDSPSEFAMVALGGYGRSELSLFSDVDVMVLHTAAEPSGIASAMFRPLWDANLRLGHAVRTIKEAAEAARQRVDTHTTLLTARLIWGSEELFERLMVEVAAVTKARPLRTHLVAQEQERRLKNPYLLMATDLKTGRGGLRTLQGFEWERRREELIGRLSIDTVSEEESARETLLRLRNALHAAAGRPYDIFSPDLRESAARWLNVDLYGTGEMLVEATQTVDSLASQRWPETAVPDEPAARIGQRVLGRLRGGGKGSDDLSVPSAEEFVAVLRSGEQGMVIMERLRLLGSLDSVLPEWDQIRTVPQMAPFHQHPAAAHLWRTVDEMEGLIQGDDDHYRSIAYEVDSSEALVLAAFLHDIGKGRGGDHASVGAEIARSSCVRLGCSGEVSDLVEGAVRHHLLLSKTATRRDLDDPNVVEEIAGIVGNLRLLRVLYLLTVADSKATGPSMWSTWKATLVRTLFIRVANHLSGEWPEAPGTTVEGVLGEADPDRLGSVKAHLVAVSDDYLRNSSTDEILWHVELVDQLEGSSNLGVRSGLPADTAVVVGSDRPGFRHLVAESFAANGIDVLEARLSSRTDGMIIDSFRVCDDRTGEGVASSRWDQARADIEAALAGELDTGQKVATRAAAYADLGPNGMEPLVSASFDDASGDTVITIKCSDRIGRLAEILAVLFACNLEIRLAKLESRGSELVDTFHVKTGPPFDDHANLHELERRIAKSIER